MSRNKQQRNEKGMFSNVISKIKEVITGVPSKDKLERLEEIGKLALERKVKWIETIFLAVKKNIQDRYFDWEEIRNAYQLIIGNDYPANPRVMKRTILQYEEEQL
jgi:hypothetical protein